MNLDKDNFVALYNLGLLRETEGKISDAISAYEKSIDRKPGFPPSRFRLGRLYEKSDATRRPSPSTPRRCGSTRRCAIRGATRWSSTRG